MDNRTNLNPTVEDAVDDNEISRSSSFSSTQGNLTPTTPPESDNQGFAANSPVTASPAVEKWVTPPPTKSVPNAKVAQASQPKDAPTTQAADNVSTTVNSSASFPLNLPFLSKVGLPADMVIESLDQLVTYMSQLVEIAVVSQFTAEDLKAENENLHAERMMVSELQHDAMLRIRQLEVTHRNQERFDRYGGARSGARITLSMDSLQMVSHPPQNIRVDHIRGRDSGLDGGWSVAGSAPPTFRDRVSRDISRNTASIASRVSRQYPGPVPQPSREAPACAQCSFLTGGNVYRDSHGHPAPQGILHHLHSDPQSIFNGHFNFMAGLQPDLLGWSPFGNGL
ncbi:hypothetical protein EG329_001480 [Mollisiaceae sp. DMI_Dod_QoI]|nr:hypothetical protein EG329_001480 [Helotiales sp. DMI_Dod_QoI]